LRIDFFTLAARLGVSINHGQLARFLACGFGGEGSKARFNGAPVVPAPLSLTLTTTYAPGRRQLPVPLPAQASEGAFNGGGRLTAIGHGIARVDRQIKADAVSARLGSLGARV
jgi:hypothetical protein